MRPQSVRPIPIAAPAGPPKQLATIEQVAAAATWLFLYEDVLRRELDGLDDDFATLKLLSQELSFRAQTIRAKKAA